MNRRIFISYRRKDSLATVIQISQSLVSHFGANYVFTDFETIHAGANYVETIEAEVNECSILIAVIGEYWLNTFAELNRREIDNSGDFVRKEISTALKNDVKIIPVLIDAAQMPKPNDLPEDIRLLSRIQSVKFSNFDINSSIDKLIKIIEKNLVESNKEDMEEELLWLRCQKNSSIEFYQKYIELFPRGKYFSISTTAIDKLSEELLEKKEKAQLLSEWKLWKQCCKIDTSAYYEKYIAEYPQGLYVQKAKQNQYDKKQEERKKPRQYTDEELKTIEESKLIASEKQKEAEKRILEDRIKAKQKEEKVELIFAEIYVKLNMIFSNKIKIKESTVIFPSPNKLKNIIWSIILSVLFFLSILNMEVELINSGGFNWIILFFLGVALIRKLFFISYYIRLNLKENQIQTNFIYNITNIKGVEDDVGNRKTVWKLHFKGQYGSVIKIFRVSNSNNDLVKDVINLIKDFLKVIES